MNQLPIRNGARAGVIVTKTMEVRSAKARPAGDMFAAIRTVGKVTMLAVEVVEIIGILALL